MKHRILTTSLGRLLAAAAVAAGADAGISPTADAATLAAPPGVTFTVNTTADAHDVTPGDGKCAASNGSCTVRAALEEGSALPSGTTVTVVVPAGTYPIILGELLIAHNAITMVGAGAKSSIVRSNGRSRILQIRAGATVTMDSLTVMGGNAGQLEGYGGGVLNSGHLLVENSVIAGNRAASGGGMSNAGGILTVSDSVVTHNTAEGYGGGGIQNGGINDVPGQVQVVNSVVSANVGYSDGGGILQGQNGHPPTPSMRQASGFSLAVIGSTLDHNSGGSGGAISISLGNAYVTGSRMEYNSAGTSDGGAIFDGGTISISYSTFVQNTACYGGAVQVATVYAAASVSNSTFLGNSACIGGAVDVSGTSASIDSSTFAANSAASGAAIEIEGSSNADISNSTITANTASKNNAALQTFACGSGTISYVTMWANTNAIDLSCPDVAVTGSIIAGSTRGPNCDGAPPSETFGYNLDSGTSCKLAKSTDLTMTRPLLAPLASNGGPTQTQALQPGSPAIEDGGNIANGCPYLDQRGVVRAIGGFCDVGAYELRN